MPGREKAGVEDARVEQFLHEDAEERIPSSNSRPGSVLKESPTPESCSRPKALTVAISGIRRGEVGSTTRGVLWELGLEAQALGSQFDHEIFPYTEGGYVGVGV